MQHTVLSTWTTTFIRPLYVTPSPRADEPAMSRFIEYPRELNWQETVRRTLFGQPADYFHPYFNGRDPLPEEKAAYIDEAVRRLTPLRVFANNLYRVEILDTPASGQAFIHLAIQRLDGTPCKEWRHLQQIKNEIVGPEYEAIELFPAESRLVDAGNQYHLWAHKDPGFRFPVGWWLRVVRDRPIPLIREGPCPDMIPG